MRRITFCDINESLVKKVKDLFDDFKKNKWNIKLNTHHWDIIEYRKNNWWKIATASNPSFTMGWWLDAVIAKNFPDEVNKASEFAITDNLFFTITVDDDIKATEKIIKRALIWFFAYASKDIIISWFGTSIGGLCENTFIDCLRKIISADLSHADLSYAALSSADLRKADLLNADLSYADLRIADLRKSNLRNAYLSHADLSYADLRKADLRSANLRKADLWSANLRKTDLSYADLSYADLSDDLLSADLHLADLSCANLRYANLRNANLRYAVLSYADLRSADLRDADLSDANLRYANLRYANLSYANLSYAALSSADLRKANLSKSNLRKSNLRNADLSYANLRYAVLSYANLSSAALSYADLRSAKELDTTLFNENTCFFSLACPEEWSFIWWKKAWGNIIKLLIPEDAKRSSATTRKCRAEFVKVLAIYDKENNEIQKYHHKAYNHKTLYETWKITKPDCWDDDRWNECSNGIHFFITRKEAENWN